MAEDAKSFWHTLPGLITACAAFVTAVAGMIGILHEAGVVGGDGRERLAGEAQAAASASAAGTASTDEGTISVAPRASTQPTNGTGRVPWERATATLVRKDGTTASVKATTVGFACTTETLTFENGQVISLELVRSVRFDAVYTDDSSATGLVTLLDGRELAEPVHTWNCPVMGTTELGPLTIPLDDFARVEFDR
jgi:hypothetical protein